VKEKILLIIILFATYLFSQNVIVVVIDGARYTETFGGPGTYIPHLYNDLKPSGYLYTNFRIDYPSGRTETCPGHAAIETGTWQPIANNGSERPTNPTVFEYLRKENGNQQADCYAVTGKDKLDILTYSDFSDYGSPYGGTWVGDNDKDDAQTYLKVISVMQNYSPKILVINFAEVDAAGHIGSENIYHNALLNADNLVYQLYQTIEAGTYGYTLENTTLFITNDHGRHTDNFSGHGDGCEGCTHIMLLALGRNVTEGVENPYLHYQIDIAPTIGDLLGFSTPQAIGTSLYDDISSLPVQLTSFSASVLEIGVKLSWRTETEVDNYGFEVERAQINSNFEIQNSNFEKIGLVEGHGNSNSPKDYSYVDNKVTGGNYSYRLKQIDTDGSFEYSKIIEVQFGLPQKYELSQNYPNPFNPVTTIQFSLPQSGNVKLSVYNLLGEQVIDLVDEFKESGVHATNFNASELNSGLYIYKLETNGFVQSKKMILIK
jgi:hypothetical protein